MLRSFCVLLVYMVLAFFSGMTWPLFVSLPGPSKQLFPGFSDADLVWQVNCNSVMQSSCIPFAVWLISRPNGLRQSVLAGTILMVLQMLVWSATCSLPFEWRQYSLVCELLLCFGMSGNAIGGALLQGTPSQISATWFPPAQRGRATAAGYMACTLGQTATYLVVLPVNSGESLRYVVYAATMFIVVFAIVPVVWFPDRPRSTSACSARQITDTPLLPEDADSATCDAEKQRVIQQEPTVFEGLKMCASNRSCMALLLSSGCSSGFYCSWQSTLAIVFSHVDGYSGYDGVVFALTTSILFMVGGFIGGWLTDNVFRRRIKTFLLICYALGVANFICLVQLLPSPMFITPRPCSYAVLLVCISSTGLFAGAVVPPSLELLAEVVYPVPEGTTGNLSILFSQLAGFVTLAIVPLVPTNTVNIIIACLFLAAGLLVLPVREVYLRAQAAEPEVTVLDAVSSR